ncbi:hypothetical protein PA598K_02647 [Paenibacillus sp. 598K]|uniref:glycosyltransferase family 2 protein n=1 Tax=Paenibacillus sp. 598K TaxID=1117987 RepID=UPI000FF9E5A6|nr:glycosyltransferase family A protein [Paenibacillus sp. 598K]GBF74310.1 hypothetical protein PA598K_02647 [Paenibacillus sp. 598K]
MDRLKATKRRPPGVSIITATHRPQFLKNMLGNYGRQRYRAKELIVIVNNDSVDLRMYRRLARAYPRVRIYQVPERLSLGQCLNCGIAVARYPLIAKFDDDDYYSPYYLGEQVRALLRTGSDVVGKHGCLVYLEATRELLLRSPLNRDRPEPFVQGGTLLFRRRVLRKVRFADRSLGEDTTFLRACGKSGFAIYATSPFNYVYMRRSDKQSHTWRVKDRFYRKGSLLLAQGAPYQQLAERRVK